MKSLTKIDKIIYTLFIILLLLIPIFTILKLNTYIFLLLSIIANLFIIIIYKKIIQKFKIKFTKFQKIAILLAILLIYIFYFISLINRKFIYYWDYSCYYNIQLKTREMFSLGLTDGIRYFIGSTWSGEYGNFLSFFPEFIFNFTNRSINSYIGSCVIIYVPYIVLAFTILLKKAIKEYKVNINNENKLMALTLIVFILFPVLHATFIYGQPDLFGLALIFLIVALTIDYNFEKIDVERLVLLLLATFMLVISRRWYLYWAIAYYFCYIIKIILNSLFNKNNLKKIIKNMFIYGILVVIFFLITLFPLIKNILSTNYSGNYSFYYSGGFITEIINQIRHLGYIIFAIIVIGMLYGIRNKKYRLDTILVVVQYFMMIFLFTRIQNMGLHHSLILLPCYLYLIYLFIMLIFEYKKFNKSLSIILVLIFIINFTLGFCNKNLFGLFTDVRLRVEDDSNYKKIEVVSNWLRKNLDEKNTAYMITHNNKYNPDKFRNFYMPDQTISNFLPYGSAVIGVHKFPIELFDSKYIITTSPFENISIEYKYNDVVEKLVRNNIFTIKKKFSMNDGTILIVYERVEKVSLDEVNLYKEALKKESKKYPNLYIDVINDYIKTNEVK